MKSIALLRPAAAVALLGLLPACQTVQRQFPTPGADWRTSIGQLQYATRKRSVIGEAVVSRHADEAVAASDRLIDFVDSMFDVMERDIDPSLLDCSFQPVVLP